MTKCKCGKTKLSSHKLCDACQTSEKLCAILYCIHPCDIGCWVYCTDHRYKYISRGNTGHIDKWIASKVGD